MSKQPIAIVITDTHLSDDTIEQNIRAFAQVVSLAEKLQVTTIIHAGDIFTSRKGQSEVVLVTFAAILDLLKEHDLKMIVIPGNHDKTDYTSESSFLQPFESHPALRIMSPTGFMLVNKIGLYFLPYYDEKLSYRSYLDSLVKSISKENYNILITHIAIDGVTSNSGIKVQQQLSPDLFVEFDLVFVGHYHDRQALSEKIIYIGSCYQANFGEDVHKGCLTLYEDGTYDFAQLDFKEYVTYELTNSSLTIAEVKNVIEASIDKRCRVKIKGKLEAGKNELIKMLDEANVKIDIDSGDDKILQQITPNTTLSAQDILNSYDQWSQQKNIEDSQYGRTILSEVI